MSAHSPPDWCANDSEQRRAANSACWQRAPIAQASFRPFIEICTRPSTRPGPLSGLTYALKDMFNVAGHRPSWGLTESPFPAACTQTAEIVRRLDEAGAERIGFARMTALAYEPSGFNSLQTAPLNPLNPLYAPGGSSSGSAVAVAAGAALVGIGSDTGGSLRIPAQACGLTAWKPTRGAIPVDGAMPLAPSLDAIGILARSAANIALVRPIVCETLHEVNAGAHDQTTRCIVIARDAVQQADASIRHACERFIAELCHLAIPIAERSALPLVTAGGEAALTVMQVEASQAHASRGDGGLGDAALARRIAKGAEISEAAYAACLARCEPLLRMFLELLGTDADVLLLPVAPIRTPLLTEVDPRSPSFRARTLYELSAYARFANLLGLPAVAIPVGLDDQGMPVAVQLVGRHGCDSLLLNLAMAIQAI